MISLRDIRLWTTLLALALSGATIWLGWPMARLGFAEATAGTRGEALRAQVDGSSAGVLAARDVVVSHLAPDPRTRERDLTALLRSAPLSPGSWLDLAIARRAAGARTEDVVAALEMSSMTGPNEALLMAGRVGFALPFWSALPPDARRGLIADLVGGWGSIETQERERLAAILQNAPDGSGEQVRAALLINGDAGAAIAKALFPPAAADAASASGAGAPAAAGAKP